MSEDLKSIQKAYDQLLKQKVTLKSKKNEKRSMSINAMPESAEQARANRLMSNIARM